MVLFNLPSGTQALPLPAFWMPLCLLFTAHTPSSPLTLKHQLLFTEETKRRSAHILEWLLPANKVKNIT